MTSETKNLTASLETDIRVAEAIGWKWYTDLRGESGLVTSRILKPASTDYQLPDWLGPNSVESRIPVNTYHVGLKSFSVNIASALEALDTIVRENEEYRPSEVSMHCSPWHVEKGSYRTGWMVEFYIRKIESDGLAGDSKYMLEYFDPSLPLAICGAILEFDKQRKENS
jgi:hypothetical protein